MKFVRLTLQNFFSYLIFHPFEADTKKDRAAALIASIACGVFSIGICHAVCAIRNYFVYRPPGHTTKQDQKISKVKGDINTGISQVDPNSPKNVPPEIEVTIPLKVKNTLDRLFEDTPYSIESLPAYPIVLNKREQLPIRENMKAPVMKGMFSGGRAFIAIKVNCNLTDENIKNYTSGHAEDTTKQCYENHRELEDVLMLYQYRETDPLIWEQAGKNRPMHPSFFTGNFTYTDGSGPTTSQEKNFELVKTLLKTGESPDTNGLIWRIPT